MNAFNPFKYQYKATFLEDKGESATLRIQQGTIDKVIELPKILLPTELERGQRFALTLQPEGVAKEGEYQMLKQLLTELMGQEKTD